MPNFIHTNTNVTKQADGHKGFSATVAILMLVTIMLPVFTGCDRSSDFAFESGGSVLAINDPALVGGRWSLEKGEPIRGFPEDMELITDGTGFIVADFKNGKVDVAFTWKTENGRFYLMNPLAAGAWGYKISGETLMLTHTDGRIAAYKRQKDYPTLVGRWLAEQQSYDFPEHMELFKDGTVDLVAMTYGDGTRLVRTGIWWTEGDRFHFDNRHGDHRTGGYRISGETLTLTHSDGQMATYKKQTVLEKPNETESDLLPPPKAVVPRTRGTLPPPVHAGTTGGGAAY